MNDRSIEIIDGAIKIFARKGYFCSTMQDVAEVCGMSKATLYQHFRSKDKLLLSIIQQFHQQLFHKLANASSNEGLSSNERLLKQIEIYLNASISNSDFIRMIILENPSMVNDEMKSYLNDMKAKAINHYRQSLIVTYGEKMEPYAYDLTYCMIGILEQYNFLLVFDHVTIPVPELSSFIMQIINLMADGLMQGSTLPMLSKDRLPNYLLVNENTDVLQEQAETIIDEMYQMLDALDGDERYLQDIHESIRILDVELKATEPQRVIVQGMLRNLDQISEMKQYVCRLTGLEQITKIATI